MSTDEMKDELAAAASSDSAATGHDMGMGVMLKFINGERAAYESAGEMSAMVVELCHSESDQEARAIMFGFFMAMLALHGATPKVGTPMPPEELLH